MLGDETRIAYQERSFPGGSLSDPRISTLGLFMSNLGIMRDPSVARQKSRQQSSMMRYDPQIELSFAKRKLALVQVPWSIVPEDESDQGQVEAAEELKTIVELFDYTELMDNLLEALWYGPGPSELNVEWHERRRQFIVSGTKPLHGDSIVFDFQGLPYLRVGSAIHGAGGGNGRLGGAVNKGFIQTAGGKAIAGFESPVRKLSSRELEILIMHIHNPAAPDYFEPEEGALIYHGRGLRDQVWFAWQAKHQVHLQWLRFLERFAGGIVVIVHPATKEGKAAAQAAIKAYRDGDFVMMPILGMDANEVKAFDIQVKEAPANTAGLFKEYCDDWSGRQFKLIIEGQELTSGTAPTGLGSGVAEAHERTFSALTKFDAIKLSRTLMEQLLARLQRWNNILPDVRMEWRWTLEDEDPKERMQAVKDGVGLGLQVKADEVREIAGLSKPEEGDDVIGGLAMPQFGELPSESLGVDGDMKQLEFLL